MKEIKLLKGELQVGEKAIVDFASLKGLKIDCKINEDEIKIYLEKDFAGLEIPANLIIKDLEIDNNTLKLKEFKIIAGGISLPLFMVLPLIKKYDFLALDTEKRELIINLSKFLPKISFKIEKIEKKEGFLLIFIKNISFILLDLVT